jgi:hypothetical protein
MDAAASGGAGEALGLKVTVRYIHIYTCMIDAHSALWHWPLQLLHPAQVWHMFLFIHVVQVTQLFVLTCEHACAALFLSERKHACSVGR